MVRRPAGLPAGVGGRRDAHAMDTFNVVVSLILVAAALVTVWFAWQAAKEGAAAARYARETVQVSQDVAAHTSATVEAVQEVASHARATVEASQAALDGAERARRVQQIRDIGQLAETTFWKAAEASDYESRSGGWRVPEQNWLAQALVGIDSPMPECTRLAEGGGDPEIVLRKASAARSEVQAALRNLQGL